MSATQSVLLYLNDAHAGGETIFYPGGKATPSDAVRVVPRAGAALVFPHGRHPLSPLHEGAPLEGAPAGAPSPPPKYVIRTDVLFQSQATFASDAWASNNVAAAMLRGVAAM